MNTTFHQVFNPKTIWRLALTELHCLTKLRIVVTVIVRYVFSLGPQFDIICRSLTP